MPYDMGKGLRCHDDDDDDPESPIFLGRCLALITRFAPLPPFGEKHRHKEEISSDPEKWCLRLHI